jgi:hypothetical protein
MEIWENALVVKSLNSEQNNAPASSRCVWRGGTTGQGPVAGPWILTRICPVTVPIVTLKLICWFSIDDPSDTTSSWQGGKNVTNVLRGKDPCDI